MRVFVCGAEFGLGFVIARQLLTAGYKVTLLTSRDDFMPNLRKNDMNPVLGGIADPEPRRALAKADAVIDATLPSIFPRKKVHVARLRPLLLRNALQGSDRPLIITSDAAALGDTGPIPVAENVYPRPLRGYAWLPRLEREILASRRVQGVVVRPAWLVHGRGCPLSVDIENWMRLAWRFKRGKYIGLGENCYSAVHLEDLAELYCLALKKARSGTILHAASENFSMKELATSIHRGMGFKGEPSSLSLEEAKRFTPIAEALTQSHALSGDLAKRSIGWRPSHDSILKALEYEASVDAWAARKKIPATECR